MLKPWLLRLHRWITLIFAAPLAVLIVTGLILAFEPIAQIATIKPGAITADTIGALLARHDPEGKARSLVFRPYENRLSIGGVRPDDSIDVDVATGAELLDDGIVSDLFYYARVFHEHLNGDFGWLVQASTLAMLVLMALGLGMGWPRLRNTVGGWHKAIAWTMLPLLVLSPLTGLFLAWGLTFSGPSATRPAAVPMAEAVRILGAQYDLSGLNWLRIRGGRLMARIVADGRFETVSINPGGVTPTARNWPRQWHEGNFAGLWTGVMNVIISLALVGLMGTGLLVWARRKFRKRPENRLRKARAAATV